MQRRIIEDGSVGEVDDCEGIYVLDLLQGRTWVLWEVVRRIFERSDCWVQHCKGFCERGSMAEHV